MINAPDAWGISDDAEGGSQGTALKSTNSARRIKALFEQVTGKYFSSLITPRAHYTYLDRYSPLPSASQHIDFLISIQLPILESYLTRITSSLDAFETLSLAFVRAVPGALNLGGKGEGTVNVNAQNLVGGVEGIQRLCKALLSAAHVELALESWAEDLVRFQFLGVLILRAIIAMHFASSFWSFGPISTTIQTFANVPRPTLSSHSQALKTLKSPVIPFLKFSSINILLSSSAQRI